MRQHYLKALIIVLFLKPALSHEPEPLHHHETVEYVQHIPPLYVVTGSTQANLFLEAFVAY